MTFILDLMKTSLKLPKSKYVLFKMIPSIISNQQSHLSVI